MKHTKETPRGAQAIAGRAIDVAAIAVLLLCFISLVLAVFPQPWSGFIVLVSGVLAAVVRLPAKLFRLTGYIKKRLGISEVSWAWQKP